MVLFDDYGQKGLETQRAVIEDFLQDKGEALLAIPTGQALLVKQ